MQYSFTLQASPILSVFLQSFHNWEIGGQGSPRGFQRAPLFPREGVRTTAVNQSILHGSLFSMQKISQEKIIFSLTAVIDHQFAGTGSFNDWSDP